MVTEIIKNEDISPFNSRIEDWNQYGITNDAVIVCVIHWDNINNENCFLCYVRNRMCYDEIINPLVKW